MGYLSDISKQLNKEQNIIFVGTGMILLNDENRILLACRTDNGQWSLPGGSLEIGESLEECAIRETKEETGITVKECDIHLNSVKSIQEPVIKNGREIYVVSVTYWARKYNSVNMQIDSREFTKYSWLSGEEIKKISKLITNYSLIAIDEFLASREHK